MKTVTIDVVKSWNPCWLKQPGGVERLEAAYAGREHWTALDIINDMPSSGVSDVDIIWTLFHDELFSRRDFVIIALTFAEPVVVKYWSASEDRRPMDCIAAIRGWLNGAVSDDELNAADDAACVAAYTTFAAADAAADAARAANAAHAAAHAARAAAWAAWAAAAARAANAAAVYAADAARADQISTIKRLIVEGKIGKDEAALAGKVSE